MQNCNAEKYASKHEFEVIKGDMDQTIGRTSMCMDVCMYVCVCRCVRITACESSFVLAESGLREISINGSKEKISKYQKSY